MSCRSSDPPNSCSTASPELRIYQAFILSVPVFFTFILLLIFCVFYLRRRRASWQSIRMGASHLTRGEISRPSDSGIKKEVREMLPVVVFKESFLIRETQCSVCLGDYQSDERLRRIPPCGHTFHVDCIDHWLATNTTCPLCRVLLLPATKDPTNPPICKNQAIEGQLQEQSLGNLNDVRVVRHDNEGEERERDSGSEGLGYVRREVEEFRHHGEGSEAAINIEGHGSAVENLRP